MYIHMYISTYTYGIRLQSDLQENVVFVIGFSYSGTTSSFVDGQHAVLTEVFKGEKYVG